ncbi:hypothetical protein CEP53_007527 [Fusarium sp. AF-6]|nr:hypothetical protein CEP53_007527 [Fusarium sp. AF-6]
MAEVLGIVAGAAQLLDLSTRVLVASSSLYGKLKNIPEEIETLKKNTELFIDLLWMISSDFDGPINSQVHSLHVTHRITSILHDARKESEELALLLESLSSNNSSSMRRKWSAVVSATKEKEIAERCRRIESFKSTLQLWYQHQSNARLRRVEHQLSQVTVSQEAAHTSMSLLAHQARRTSTVIDSNRAIVKRLDSHEDPAPSLEQHRRRRPRRNATLCTCRPSGSRAYLSIYGLQLFYSQETSHLPNCPHRNGSISWSCGVRTLSPRIQMMVGIQLGGWTLSMVGGLSPHNIVDEEKSPAFIALKEATRALLRQRHEIKRQRKYQLAPLSIETNRQEEVKMVFEALLQQLREAYGSGSASPGDYTANDSHALHHFIGLAMLFTALHGHLSCVFDDLVELLVAGNVDLSHQDPLYRVVLRLNDAVHIKNNKLDRILINHGCIASQSVLDEASNPCFVAMFRENPSILEGHEQYLAHAVVIQRSETELRRLLRQNKIDLRTTTPSILSLAVGWPNGLQILLDAGANPDDAILTAIFEDHLPSIELLVDNGCSLFDLAYYGFFSPKHWGPDALFCAASLPASSGVCDSYHSDDECYSDDDYYSGSDSGDDDSSEQGEIQEEDRHLKQALDSYLELYLCLLDTYADRFEAFWVAWWIALEYFLPFETSSGEHLYHPPNFGNVGDPQSYDKDQSHDSYKPNVEAITAFLADCVPQLSSETRARFFCQFKPTEDELRELSYLSVPVEEASLIDDKDGKWDECGRDSS